MWSILSMNWEIHLNSHIWYAEIKLIKTHFVLQQIEFCILSIKRMSNQFIATIIIYETITDWHNSTIEIRI